MPDKSLLPERTPGHGCLRGYHTCTVCLLPGQRPKRRLPETANVEQRREAIDGRAIYRG
jgi:hypothetical protein